MKTSLAIVVGTFCVSTVQAATFVVEVTGVVRTAIGQNGGALDAAQPGDPVTETFVFDTDRFPTSVGDGATFLAYQNAYVTTVDAVRSRITVGAASFEVGGYPLLSESVSARDSGVTPVPPGIPPPAPTDQFSISDASATVALNVPGAQGRIRSVAFGAAAPGASSLVTVPVTNVANVHLAEAATLGSLLLEGSVLAVSATTLRIDTANARLIAVTGQTVTLRRCENRLHWFDAGLPWPKHGVHCEAEDEDED